MSAVRLERTRDAVLLLYRFPEWVGEPPSACTKARDAALAELEQAEAALAGILRFADESDYCVACGEHPSHGHAESCLFAAFGSGEGDTT